MNAVANFVAAHTPNYVCSPEAFAVELSHRHPLHTVDTDTSAPITVYSDAQGVVGYYDTAHAHGYIAPIRMTPVSDCTGQQGNPTTVYDVYVTITCSGVGAWHDCTGNKVLITQIRKEEVDVDGVARTYIMVHHNQSWKIYGDAGFVDMLCDLTGWDLRWAGLGLQVNGLSALELNQ